MNIELVKISDLHLNPKNTRFHTQKQLDELVRSYKKFGQIRPVVIDENNVIWCGNGFYEALKNAGYTELYALRKANMTEDDKKKLMLADNQIFTLGGTNAQAMDEILAELSDYDIPGFDESTLEQIYGDIGEAAEAMSNYGVIDEETVNTLADVQETRNNAQEHHVDLNKAQEEDESLPTDIKEANGMLNVPKDKDTRPFIVCPRCGEKIWV